MSRSVARVTCMSVRADARFIKGVVGREDIANGFASDEPLTHAVVIRFESEAKSNLEAACA
jgi:hypothetical protein